MPVAPTAAAGEQALGSDTPLPAPADVLVLVINMDTAPVRFAKWAAVPGVRRVAAVNGKALAQHPRRAMRAYPNIPQALWDMVLRKRLRLHHLDMNSPGELGCYLSHLAALQQLVDAPAHVQGAFVCEDDYDPHVALLAPVRKPLGPHACAQALLDTVARQPWAADAMRIHAAFLCAIPRSVRYKGGGAPVGAVATAMGNLVNWYPRAQAAEVLRTMRNVGGQFDCALASAGKWGFLDVRAAPVPTKLPYDTMGELLSRLRNAHKVSLSDMHLPPLMFLLQVVGGVGIAAIVALLIAAVVLGVRYRRLRKGGRATSAPPRGSMRSSPRAPG